MPKSEPKKRERQNALTTRTGGAYIPPAKLRMMQKNIEDKSSAEYQRLAWEQLKKSINGLINKVNTSNLTTIVRELIKQNLVRGRGLLCRSIMQAQSASQTFTNVYAALVAIINSKFPNIGELLLRRLVIQFRRGYKRNDKPTCLAAAKFIAHLVNQQVAHEVLGLEILTLLLEHPTEDSVEVAIAFLKEVGARLEEVSPRGAHAIFERLRHVLHEGHLEKRVQYMIEVMFQVRKDKFKDFPTLPDELDLVEEEDQFTHLLTLDEVTEGQDILNVFKLDDDYVGNEDKYATLRKEILDESEDDGSDAGGDDDDDDEDAEEDDEEAKDAILDKTETNLLALRRTIYLTIQSSLDFEECCHKLLKMNMKEGQEIELCHMILDCCAQQRTYEKFFGLLAQRFCNINRKYVDPFQQIFKDTYDTVHRLDTNKLRNVGKFFAHLLFTDAIAWTVLEHIRLTEEDTTSSSRIFIKILMQELSEYMGLQKLNQRLQDPTLIPHFEGLFPRDHPKNTRFSINFFTSVGLGGLTDDLREFLKKQPKPTAVIAPQRTEQDVEVESSSDSSSSSSSSSSDSSSSSSSDSSSDSSSESSSSAESEEERSRKRKTSSKHNKAEGISKSSLPRGRKRDMSKNKSRRSRSQSTDRRISQSEGIRSDRDRRQRELQDDQLQDIEMKRHRKYLRNDDQKNAESGKHASDSDGGHKRRKQDKKDDRQLTVPDSGFSREATRMEHARSRERRRSGTHSPTGERERLPVSKRNKRATSSSLDRGQLDRRLTRQPRHDDSENRRSGERKGSPRTRNSRIDEERRHSTQRAHSSRYRDDRDETENRSSREFETKHVERPTRYYMDSDEEVSGTQRQESSNSRDMSKGKSRVAEESPPSAARYDKSRRSKSQERLKKDHKKAHTLESSPSDRKRRRRSRSTSGGRSKSEKKKSKSSRQKSSKTPDSEEDRRNLKRKNRV